MRPSPLKLKSQVNAMSMERGRTEVGASAEAPLHDKWQMDLFPLHESSTSEAEDGRQATTGWLVVVVDPTGLLILGVGLFGEKPRSHEIADVFEELRARWDDREPDDEVALPAVLELGFGLWAHDGALKQRTVLRGTGVVGPILSPPGWMPERAADYLERKAGDAELLTLGGYSSHLRCFLTNAALGEFNGRPRSEREEILCDLEWHSPCAVDVPRKPRQLRKAG